MYLTIFSSQGLFILLLIIMTDSLCPFGTFGSRCQFQCHCKKPLDCNQSSGYCSSGCTRPWSGRNCQQENISFNASTNHKTGEGSTDSWFGVDGNNTTCAVTSTGRNGWWMVKLKKTGNVNKIFLKSDDNTPMYSWQILVGDNGNLFTMQTCSELKTYDSSSSIFCDRPQRGQYLAVLNPHGPVVICELNVYVCSKLRFGVECERECSCKDSTEQCDSQTGSCTSGCRPGRVGISCQIECDGSYGPKCAYPCGHCYNGTCDSMTGICPFKCEHGWKGLTCHTECQPGLYGYNCSSRCGHCYNGSHCNPTTGSCPGGCGPGWSGHTCKQECKANHFGRNCSQKCSNCFGGVCEKQTGRCVSGCKPGLHGNKCYSVCASGRWGLGCSEFCGYCQNKSCDPVNGKCHCQSGWTGDNCYEACPVGTYGKDCSEKCGHCTSGTTCNTTTGVCHDGCKDGFNGENCKLVLAAESSFTEEGNNTLQVFLGISVTMVLSVMACLIVCLVSNWRREDISKYDRTVEKCGKDINMEEIRHLNCNGQL